MRRQLGPLLVSGAVLAAGALGLARAAVPDSVSTAGATITVTNAYVRAPVPPTRTAAAYLTLHNPGDTSDALVAVRSDAGSLDELHAMTAPMTMTGGARMAAGMNVVRAITIPAHGTLTMATGADHVMIEKLTRAVTSGGRVRLHLMFRHAQPITVSAPVIAVGAAAPTANRSGSRS